MWILGLKGLSIMCCIYPTSYTAVVHTRQRPLLTKYIVEKPRKRTIFDDT